MGLARAPGLKIASVAGARFATLMAKQRCMTGVLTMRWLGTRGARVWAPALMGLMLMFSAVAPGDSMRLASAKGDDVCPEPNDGFQAACYLGPGSDALGFISRADDVDAYRFEALDFNTAAHVEIADQPFGYQFVIANWNGEPVATSKTDGGREVADVSLPLPGSYYVFVQTKDGRFSDTQPYRVLTRMRYASTPDVVYRSDFRAGTGDENDSREMVDFTQSDGRLTIALKTQGSPKEPTSANWWLAGTPPYYTLSFDTRIVSGAEVGYRVLFNAPDSNNYRQKAYTLVFDTELRRVALSRWRDNEYVDVVKWQDAQGLAADGRVNRTVLRIGPDGLRVNVNGQDTLTFQEDMGEGFFAFGAISWGSPATVSFDNALVTTP